MAGRLKGTFKRVVVSDAGRANVMSACEQLSSSSCSNDTIFPKECHDFVFVHSAAETIHTALSPASTDFACVAMAFHYFDAPVAIESIAATLRPGGTPSGSDL